MLLCALEDADHEIPIFKMRVSPWAGRILQHTRRFRFTRAGHTNLASVRETKEPRHYVVAATNCVQFFFIHQRNLYSPLAIKYELLETLLYEKCIPPSFKDHVPHMGQRVREVEIALPSLRRFPTELPRSDGDVRVLECMYGLRFVDLNGRGNLHQPT